MTTRFKMRGLNWGLVLALAAPGPALAQVPAPAAETRVVIDRFVVTGNTLLAQETLDAALARFKGERTLPDLQQAALAVQALYRDAGFGAVIAYLPPQSGAAGQATIVVLEGRISKVTITGNRQFSDANVRRSVPALVEGGTPPVRRIDTQLRMANENPARQLALALEAGALPGEVDARIGVSEQPASRWSVALDNTGTQDTGRLRLSLGYQNAALWDLDHVVALQLQGSPEEPSSVAVVSASYRVPLYGSGWMVDLFAAYSDVNGGTTSTLAGPLQFSGQGELLGLRMTRPLERLGDSSPQGSWGLDRRVYLNDCSILGLPAGACGAAGASVAVHPLSLDYALQSEGDPRFGFNIGISRNLDLGGSHADPADYQAVRPGAPLRYTLARIGAFGALALPNAWQLQGRFSSQWTADALVPGEQFGIAGANAVRGYNEREITGDSGVAASVELFSPDLMAGTDKPQAALRLLGFADAGRAVNRLDTPCREGRSSCTLASLGIGARLGLGALQVRLDVARALEPGVRSARGDTRGHLQAVYRFP